MKTKSIFSIIFVLCLIVFTSCPSPLEPEKLALLKDLEAPRIVITSPADYSEYATVIELEGYIEDTSLVNLPADAELSVSYRIPGTSISGTVDVSLPEGAFFGLINVSDLSGEKVIEFTAADINGNTASMSVNIVKPAGGGDISGFTVTPANKQVTISWDPVPGAESYEIFESSYGETITSDMITGTSYTWSGLENGEIYNFQLTAHLPEEIGDDAVSEFVTKMPLSKRTFAPWVKEVGYKSITIEWLDNEIVDRYIVERSLSPEGPWEIARILSDNIYTDTKVLLDTPYYYRITPNNYKDISSYFFNAVPGSFGNHQSELIYTNYAVNSIDFSGDYAYVAANTDEVIVLDITNRDNPVEAARLPLTSTPLDIRIFDSYAAVACGESGLAILNIENPLYPALLNYTPTYGSACVLSISNQHAFLAENSGGLTIIDISTPETPMLKSNTDTSGHADVVAVYDNHAYIADHESGLAIINVSDLLSPGTPVYVPPYLTYTYDVCIVDNYAYVCEVALSVIDIATPSAPNTISNINMSGCASRIRQYGNRVFVMNANDSDNPFNILDTADPANPAIIYSGEDISLWNLNIYDGFIYGGYGGYGIRILDVADLNYSKGICVEESAGGQAERVEISGNHVFILNNYGNIEIIDITAPSTPGTHYEIDAGASNDFFSFKISGEQLITSGLAGLLIYDISDLSEPKILNAAGGCIAADIFVRGDYAFLAAGGSGLAITDISDPVNIEIVSSISSTVGFYDIAYRDEYLFITDGTAGLAIIDITDPTEPIEVVHVDTLSANAVEISGSYAYVADGANGLAVIDISEPENPEPPVYKDTSGDAVDVTISGSYAFVADSDSGIAVIDISDPEATAAASDHIYFSTNDEALGIAVSGSYAYIADDAHDLGIIYLRE